MGKNANSELDFSDEREKIIVAESTKTAYIALIGGLIVSVAAIGGINLFSLSMNIEIDIYFAAVSLLVILLDIATICYGVRWVSEYLK